MTRYNTTGSERILLALLQKRKSNAPPSLRFYGVLDPHGERIELKEDPFSISLESEENPSFDATELEKSLKTLTDTILEQKETCHLVMDIAVPSRNRVTRAMEHGVGYDTDQGCTIISLDTIEEAIADLTLRIPGMMKYILDTYKTTSSSPTPASSIQKLKM